MAKNKSSSGTSPADPRLKSFLRKAGAIIAAEKGLNAASRIKLQTLAEHLKLPPELLDEGLVRLQKGSEPGENLTHYEKAFLKFLRLEFKKISGDVLSRGMEVKAIRLAETKYQINGTRAEQLIQFETESAGISRISQAEAEAFATRTIADQIRDRTVVDEEETERLLKIGKKWGIEPDAVVQIIAHRIRENRAQKRTASNVLVKLAVCLTLVISGLIGPIMMGWIPNWIGLPNGMVIGHGDRLAPGLSGISVTQNAGAAESRFPTKLLNDIASLTKSNSRLRDSSNKIIGSNETQRRIGYRQLTRDFCERENVNRDSLAPLIVSLFYHESDEESALEVTRTLAMFLELDHENGLRAIGTVRDLKNAYAANRLLGDLLMHGSAPQESATFNARFQNVAACVETCVGIPIDQIKTSAVYRELAEAAIATDQWTLMSQNSWRAPGQVALVTQPLLDLTESKLAPELWIQFRGEVVLSILKSDDSQWENLRTAIRDSVESSGEVKLMEWVGVFEKAKGSPLRKFLGDCLVIKMGLKLRSNRQEEFANAIQEYKMQRQHEFLRPVIDRNQHVTQTFKEAFGSIQVVESEGALALPDRIANLVRAVNLGLAFCEAMESPGLIDDSNFSDFDRLAETPKTLLRDSIALPIDRSRVRDAQEQQETASDIRRKEAMLERLSDLDPENAGLRILALNQLERVSPQFNSISYEEATILAKYLLADLNTKELLNIQRLIASFIRWPNLALAFADRIVESSVGMDQALTISRLLLASDFEIEESTSWKESLRDGILRAVAENVEHQIRQDPDNSNSNWNRLEIYLTESYRQRAAIFSVASRSRNANQAPHQSLVKLLKLLAKTRLDQEDRKRIDRAADLVDELPANEIDKAIFANQLLIQVLSIELSRSGKSNLITPLMSEFQIGFKQNQLAGEQLYLTELMLLQMVELKKDMLYEQLVTGR